MKTCVFVCLCILISLTTQGQTTENITEYFDKDWNTVSDKQSAAYYRTVEYKDNVIMLRDYYISGKIQMVAECIEVDPKPVFDGKVTRYYENGTVKSEGNYRENEEVGVHKSYYENGSLQTELVHFPKEKSLKSKYIHFFSLSGEELLVYGKGVVPTGSNEKCDLYTEVEDSVAIASFSVSKVTKDTIYGMAEKMAEYKGGLSGLASYLQKTVRYPKAARKQRAQGTVYISFVIDEHGVVKESNIVKGVSPECDAEALKAVSGMENWIPAEHKGVPVKSRFVLPIKFKIAI